MNQQLKKQPKEKNHEVTIEEVHEIYKQLSATEPTATTYKPIFNPDVKVLGPDDALADVSENYCLRTPSAMGLMCILADLDPVGYMDYPQLFATGSTMYYSQQVPWLRFNNGAIRNAGQLAQFWKANFGDPNGKIAEEMARQDIAWG